MVFVGFNHHLELNLSSDSKKKQASPATQHGEALALDNSLAARSSLSGVCVLIVDDYRDNRDLISYFLNREGAKIMLADGGGKAIELAFQVKPDIILMDIQMPVIDGYEATRRLREAGYNKPIIAITANGTGTAQKCLEAGCSAFVPKPFNIPLLLATILEHI